MALSRAKHGQYILGNAANLRQNKIWHTILDEMEARDQVGEGFPIICPRHPEQTRTVKDPTQLKNTSPEGGCLLACEFQLPCGHLCPSVVSIFTSKLGATW